MNIQWFNILRGFAMGISDLIPGVSGGTIALLLGIYEDFIGSISKLFSKDFKKSFLFLLPIGIGMLLAIGGLSGLINYLLEFYPVPTMFLFVGLIFGTIPFLLRISEYKREFSMTHWLVVLIFAIALASLAFFGPEKSQGATTNLDLSSSMLLLYFIAGICASSAMLLPGISGSFVLLLFGVYHAVIFSISQLVRLNFVGLPILFLVGLGVLVGFIFASKLIAYLLDKHTYMTYAAILGLIIGSLASIYPGLPTSLPMWIASGITLVVGFLISSILGRYTEA